MFGFVDCDNKSKTNLLWLMLWYNWTYTVSIDEKLQTNEQLKSWLTNPNRNFNETNAPRSPLN